MDSKVVIASCLFLLVLATHDNGVSAGKCSPVSAAVTVGDTLFFFYGHQYIAYDKNYKNKLHTGMQSTYFADLPNGFVVDAAFTPATASHLIILISQDRYLVYRSDGSRTNSFGTSPLRNIFYKHDDFAEGIDAAAMYKGEDYFFKGCTLLVKNKKHQFIEHDLTELGIPCDINAAWVNGKGLLVISKGEHAWRLEGTKKLNSDGLCFVDTFPSNGGICKCL